MRRDAGRQGASGLARLGPRVMLPYCDVFLCGNIL